ncbi:MAG: penicillin-binding protein activator LpoB [Nitrospirae bacterium]|nr:penicillin-binding protein activator LpoB [Nitrospirota bacterium]
MKRFVLALLLLLSMAAGVISAYAQEKPRLGVLRFTNDTRASWWTAGAGRDLQDMLASELVSTKSFQVLERKEIDAVIGEQDLGASGRIDPSTKAKIGKIKGAQYLIAATVSAFEENTEGQGGGIGIAGINIGGSEAKAYMAVDLKVIDATTGEVVDARTVEATSKSSSSGVSGGYWLFSGSMSQHKKTPVGKAIRACIIEISEYLQCSLTKKDSGCMSAYDAKDTSRKEKTKKSIDLE